MLEWRPIERNETYHYYFLDGSGSLALSHEADGWYWGAFSYATGLRISDAPKPYIDLKSAREAAEDWYFTNKVWRK